ncbi:MAG: hypothetical protein QHI48_05630 [Bacteroidota bacterium]|nr:hypothetical protein [Bacteroidota bacterium]
MVAVSPSGGQITVLVQNAVYRCIRLHEHVLAAGPLARHVFAERLRSIIQEASPCGTFRMLGFTAKVSESEIPFSLQFGSSPLRQRIFHITLPRPTAAETVPDSFVLFFALFMVCPAEHFEVVTPALPSLRRSNTG